MKKILFTCFLAFLCLFGSPSSAQSKVAESPPEMPLHRSALRVSPHSGDTHRGGETLSDTFLKYTNGPEVTRLPLLSSGPWTMDRGPNLPSPVSDLPSLTIDHGKSDIRNPKSHISLNFSLVDRYLDPGAGEETLSLHPAPVTVSSDQAQLDEDANHKSSGSQCLDCCVLCLDSCVACAERGRSMCLDSSTQEGEGMLHIEIASADPPDTLWVTYWEHLLEDSKAVTPGISIPLTGEKGTYFEGSSGTVEFNWTVPDELMSGYFSLGLGKDILVRQWSLSSGDRARIRFDLNTGTTLFGGPKADFFRSQFLLDQVFGEERFNSDPILIAGSSEGLFDDARSAAAYRKAHSQPEDIYRRMRVLVPGENGWDHLMEYLARPGAQNPSWRILESARPLLTDVEYGTLDARVKGEILLEANKKAEIIAGQLIGDKKKGDLFLQWTSEINAGNAAYPHPLLIQGITRLEILKSKIRGEELMENLAEYPAALRDELIGYFLLSNYNRLKGNLDRYLQIGIELVQTPWISEKLTGLREIQLGRFISEGLLDHDGNPVNLDRYSGKTLLIHFWISGCKFCADDYRQSLKPLDSLLASDPDFLIVTVNGDGSDDSWKAGLASGNYTSEHWLNLRASKGIGVLERYQIHSFPQKMLIGPDSKVRLQALDKMSAERLLALLRQIQSVSDTSFSSTQTSKP